MIYHQTETTDDVGQYISEDQQAADSWWAAQWNEYELTHLFIDGQPVIW